MSDHTAHGNAHGAASLFHGVIYAAVAVSSLVFLFTPYYYMALAPGVLLAGAVLLGRAPEFGYYAIIALIPFGHYRSIGALQGLKIHWVIAAGVIAILLLRGLIHKKRLSNIGSNLWGPLAVLCSVAFVSNLFSDYPATAYRDLVRFVLGLVFFSLGVVLINRDRLRRGVTYAIVFSVGIGAFLAVLGYFFYIPWFAHDATPGDFVRGSGGTAANNLALMIVFSVPLAVHWLVQSRSFFMKLLFLAVLVIDVLALITTFSRGGALVFSITALFTAFYYRYLVTPRRVGFILCIGLIVVLTAVAVVPQSYWERQASLVIRTVPDKAIGRRASYLAVGWESFKENPVLGSGLGTFREIYERSDVSRKFNKQGMPEERYAHNTYVEVLVGTGVIGFAVFLVLLLRMALNLFRAKRIFRKLGNNEMVGLTNAYLLSFLSLLLYFFLKSAFEHKFFFVLMAVTQVCVTEALRAEAEAVDA